MQIFMQKIRADSCSLVAKPFFQEKRRRGSGSAGGAMKGSSKTSSWKLVRSS